MTIYVAPLETILSFIGVGVLVVMLPILAWVAYLLIVMLVDDYQRNRRK